MAVLPLCASGGRFIAGRTHRKERDVCATQARPRHLRERSRNVSWNQWLDELRSHRALVPGEIWGGAYMAVFAMCASGGRSSRLTHIAKSAMYAPQPRGAS